MKDLITLVNQLRSYGSEREWFEFKVNWYEPAAIGEYISAISNSAACKPDRTICDVDQERNQNRRNPELETSNLAYKQETIALT